MTCLVVVYRLRVPRLARLTAMPRGWKAGFEPKACAVIFDSWVFGRRSQRPIMAIELPRTPKSGLPSGETRLLSNGMASVSGPAAVSSTGSFCGTGGLTMTVAPSTRSAISRPTALGAAFFASAAESAESPIGLAAPASGVVVYEPEAETPETFSSKGAGMPLPFESRSA